jgi:DNA-binding response OmpR family regulator
VRKRILIVDDNESFGELLRDLLNIRGYAASYSPDLNQARELMEVSGKPHFLVLDYRLKECTTGEFAVSLKSLLPDAKIIMVSGEVEEVHKLQKLVKEGIASAYIAKPFGEEDLTKVILALEDLDARDHHPAGPPPHGRQI